MALKQFHPGQITIAVETKARGHSLPRKLTNVPGGLYPMRSACFEIDEYRLLAGWPVPVPVCGIHADTLVSGDGTLLADRDSPTSVLTGANYRWLADPNFFNVTTASWVPIQGGDPIWGGDPTHLPSLINSFEYTVDDERFTSMNALNFDSDTADVLTTNLARAMSTTKGYSIIFVMSPNSVYGNNVDVSYNTLWSNPIDEEATNIELTIQQDGYLWVEFYGSPPQRGIAMNRAIKTSAPSYLAVVIDRPRLSMM